MENLEPLAKDEGRRNQPRPLRSSERGCFFQKQSAGVLRSQETRCLAHGVFQAAEEAKSSELPSKPMLKD